jgi:hypothetical protein
MKALDEECYQREGVDEILHIGMLEMSAKNEVRYNMRLIKGGAAFIDAKWEK